MVQIILNFHLQNAPLAANLYIPHGSDNTLLILQVHFLLFLFISHMVQIILGLSDSGMLYVLDAEGAKISDLRLIDRIITKYKLWWPGKIIFEIQTFQEIYKNQLLREALKQNVILPVIGVKQTSNKKFRISKLSPLIEAGIVLFRKEQTLLLTQLENFPKDHDDLPDALEMAVSALISAGSGPVEYETVARRRYRNKRGGIW